ncbi:MAG TPA: 3-hydroxybutyryl-CoA dehydrogenase [Actinomycetota bacterium]|nr:3-hydroxybutyryl-CoA dehydrogenase [Actinomycetota bacterium]
MEIKKVGVLGCGTMGAGICEIVARSGYKVVFKEVDEARVDEGLERIKHSIDRGVSSGKMSEEERAQVLSRISGSTVMSSLADADLVVEAVPEFPHIKRKAFRELDETLSPDAIIATNTSSLSVIELAVATQRPERVLGIHFFNPAPVMQLVELVKTVTSAPDVVQAAKSFVESLGKTPVVCRDRAGFIGNLLLFPYLNEAVKLLDAGFASREDIDAAMRLGAGHPIGPLALLDLVGLDSCAEILESLHRQFEHQRYIPSPAFRHLVTAGYLGRKTGKGFYTYEEPDAPRVVADNRSGAAFTSAEQTNDITSVGIVGTGVMATGIAEVAAAAGFDVVLRGRSKDSLRTARERIEKSTQRAVDKGKVPAEQRGETLRRISFTDTLEQAAMTGLVIESVAEDMALKKQIFAALDKAAPPETLLATGTSSLPVVEMAAATSRPDKVMGLHFFNPANLMKLVEIVRTVATSAQALVDAEAAVIKMGKHAVFCGDRAGFIVNRLLFPYLNDAVKMLEEGYASAEDIDTAMRLGCRHPMGPIELIDLVGLDVTLEILKSLHAEFREDAFKPSPLLDYMVQAGYLGRKAGQGFFAY